MNALVVLKGNIPKLEQALKRQKQQGDQGSMLRQTAIIDLVRALADMNSEVSIPRAEADAAIAA